jgi:hypothetical protein
MTQLAEVASTVRCCWLIGISATGAEMPRVSDSESSEKKCVEDSDETLKVTKESIIWYNMVLGRGIEASGWLWA